MVWLIILLTVTILHAIVLSVFVLLEQRKPVATLAWILILLFIPIFGAVFYYLFGRMRFERRRRLRASSLTQLDLELAELELDMGPEGSVSRALDISSMPGISGLFDAHFDEHDPGKAPAAPLLTPTEQKLFEQNQPLITLARRVVDMPLVRGNHLDVLNNAEHKFDTVAEEIAKATHHIHMIYYIFRSDKTGTWIRDLLIERAKEGVKVRVLYDWIGSLELAQDFWKPLTDVGADCVPFLPLRFPYAWRKSQLNFRNHRKVVIVDGLVGFTGGINVGDEYRGLDPAYGYWRDSHVRIGGPAVLQLQQVFVEDWCYATGDMLVDAEYYPKTQKEVGQELVQMIASGPDQPWYSIHLLFFLSITSAHQKVWITTPYFIPDDSILTALESAALRGVDVRLLLPGKLDMSIVLYAGRSYYKSLLRAGVRIYEYEKGLLHAKTMVVDRRCGTIGSANMDIRSFHLNFELNAFVYSESFAASLEESFLQDILDAKEIDLISFVQRPWSQKFAEASARLLSPIL